MTSSIAERRAFERDGFSGPFRAFSREDAAAFARIVERDVLSSDGPDSRSRAQSRHLDHAAVYALCTAEPIVRRVAEVLGDDVVLWRSNFFEKAPGAPALDWHRDRMQWQALFRSERAVSAWLALEPASVANGCVRVIPGSSRRGLRPEVRRRARRRGLRG